VNTHDITVDPFEAARIAAAAIAERAGTSRHDVALVLGSGWAAAADQIGDTIWESHTTDLPHFAQSTVPGHGGIVRSVRHGDLNVLLYMGRTHVYEDHGIDAVAHAVRTAAAAGCRTVVFTNGAGSMNPGWLPGTPVLIHDHINFTGKSPTGRIIPMTDQVKSVEDRGTHVVVITYGESTLHYGPNQTVRLVEEEEAIRGDAKMGWVRLGYGNGENIRGVSVT
jgi:hypothetical protein